jgi:transcriptional regulator with XRE-family HTH domain
MPLGDRFKKARDRVGLSQGQVAEYAETGQGYLSNIELNKRWPSTWELLEKLARQYKTSTDYLLGLTDDPKPYQVNAIDNDKMTAEQVELLQQIIDEFSALSAGQQRFAINMLRMMRQAEEEEHAPLSARIVE